MTAGHAVRAAARVVISTVVITLAGLTGTSLAATFTVNSPADAVDVNGCSDGPCTLRDAVIAANAAGGSSTINLPANTYDLTIAASGNDDATTGDLNVTAAITIIGAGAGTTIIDGGGSANTVTDRVFRVESTGSLTLSGATIRHGHPAGGKGTLSEGGGVLALGPLSLTDASVSNNFVETPNDQPHGAGAGISQEANVSISLTRVAVSGNTVTTSSGVIGGGGGLMLAGGSPGTVTITDSTISGNTSAGPGGGIYSNPLANGGSITITGSTISGNHAQLPPNLTNSNHAWGGGLATDGAVPVTLTTDSIVGNTADQSGGGIFDNGASTYAIKDTSVLSNTAVAGCTACGADFVGGGGIVADGGSRNPGWTLSGDTIALNHAGDSNHPNVPGGGIDEDGGDAFTIVNTTLFGNAATGIGGGYESSGGGFHKLTNVTIDFNSAGSGGGNLDNSGGGTFTLGNTIVSRGMPANCGGPNQTSHMASLGHNLESANTCGLLAPSDLTNTDPKLVFVSSNGGPTLTDALPADSPAVDAGDNALCPPSDQRGGSRSENGVCDIGAYEFLHSITVTNANDSGPGSLRDAIMLSGPGSTIDFAPALNGHTIMLTSGTLTIPHALTIAGPGAGQITLDGNNIDTVFDVETSGQMDTVAISGLTITHGAASLSGSTGGGGILAGTVGLLSLTDVTVTGNTATASSARSAGGGGVFVDGGELAITNSKITNNHVSITGAQAGSNGGGGVYSSGGSITITGSTVSGNTVDQSATVKSGSDGGGGIYSDGGALTLTDTRVENNSDSVDSTQSGSDGGGGIYSSGGKIVMSGDTVTGNTFTLTSSTVGYNGGGGVYSEGGRVTITSSSVDANTAAISNDTSPSGQNGGGGLFSEGGAISVTASSLAGNAGSITAAAGGNGGGAVYDEGGRSTYLNSTLSGNSMTVTSSGADNGGGGIYSAGGNNGTVSLSDATLAGNTINQPGGAIFDESGTYTFKNTIVGRNSGNNCAVSTQPGSSPKFTSAGFNLESANDCGLNQSTDITNTDPKLGPLQDNGGPTRTQALPANSPAVDAGSCTDATGDPVTTDQRGTPRPQPSGGKCDIGAYELIQASSGPPNQPGNTAPPTAQTGPPATKTSTGATLAATVNPEGQVTTVVFEYGLDPSYRPPGASTELYDHATTPQSLPADTNPHAVAATISGLIPNAVYHVRVVASSAGGTAFGPDQTFTTPAGPKPPAPVVGRNENATPVSGHVFVLVAGQLVPLTDARRLPSGAVIDARRGALQLTAALPHTKLRETGVFAGAIFRVTQAGQGLTTLTVQEGAFKGAPTYAGCTAHGAADPGAYAALSSRVLQTLRARASGRFRTRGRYAAGTVRGTQWTTTDRCDGTQIAVQVHSVLVTDFVKNITVLVNAGHSYLARARR